MSNISAGRRLKGSLWRQWAINSTKSAEAPGGGAGTSASRTVCAMPIHVSSSWYGYSPVAHSRRTRPVDQISDANEYGAEHMRSGDMYLEIVVRAEKPGIGQSLST